MAKQHEQKRGAWMQTVTGGLYYPSDPRPEEVNIIDIAHALSRICRFGGHAPDYYSVAQHSVLVAHILPPELQLWGLLHDAAEAFVGDVVRPIKYGHKKIKKYFCEMEDKNLKVIMEKYGLEMPMPSEVREADDIVLATEIRDLMHGQHVSYGLCDVNVEPLRRAIVPWDMDSAKTEFLDMFEVLAGCLK